MMTRRLRRFSDFNGLPLMKEDRLENAETLRQLIEPEGKRPYALHHFLASRCHSRWPAVREWARELCSLRRVAVQSPRVDYPRIASNSHWLYHASDRVATFRWLRYAELPLAVYLATFSRAPAVLVLVLFFFYHFGAQAAIYEPLRRLCVRMDYLPGPRLVSIAKLGWAGRLQNSLWRLEDFERVDTRQELEQLGAVWKFFPLMNMDLMYRNRATGELLCFDAEGMWNWEGLAHPDLNRHAIPQAKP